MKKMKVEGKCYYCKEKYSENSISRHLSTHLKTFEKEKLSNKKSYHIKIKGGKVYFLHLLISEDQILEDLDCYLREIWLECCGHLSSFEIKGTRGLNNWLLDRNEYGMDTNTKIGDLFKKGLKLNYKYDFGSTTCLEINIVNEYSIEDEEKILLLSRNEPLKNLCDLCQEKSAHVLCLMWHENETMFCNSCKKYHSKKCSEFTEYGEVKIVNSPRMGVCVYEGGTIDIKRDGVWKK